MVNMLLKQAVLFTFRVSLKFEIEFIIEIIKEIRSSEAIFYFINTLLDCICIINCIRQEVKILSSSEILTQHVVICIVCIFSCDHCLAFRCQAIQM
jgi:hypothetical protein